MTQRIRLPLTAAAGLLAAWTFLPMAHADSFPAVADLPSHPEMPNPLVMFDGKPVTTQQQWFTKRRPELKALFQYYMYGYLPAAPAKVAAKLEREDRQAFGGKATLKEITLTVGPPAAPKIHLLLVVPNNARLRRRSSSA